tara:strand:- start:4589 stop:4783 length:195 start_codon:yes stop_codon:yes gene_type:complete
VTPKELKATYKSVFGSDDGKQVLEDMEKRFGLWRTSYVPDSNETAFREGQRDVVLFIHATLKEK